MNTEHWRTATLSVTAKMLGLTLTRANTSPQSTWVRMFI
ncbi:hypothetical protein EGR_11056 [Echinococcus granulosus]|uniref:Uncharacterized protein n=1 Tax=Echinococcus granulosus TaxID=6210 RepID=W6UKR3_ECHGR|nr:hypothetical protein EGR_11056 [Echinococcus granulosus]EUB54084.1 hypothetical protein EGR_11056 [Echinococcus granulosus]